MGATVHSVIMVIKDQKSSIISGIYIILNWENSKVYVGSASYLRKRMQDHACSLRKNQHKNIFLQRAWNKYGEKSFTFSVLEYCDRKKLLEREQFWINHYQSSDSSKGYNLAKIAGSTIGVKWTEAQRIKWRAKRVGTKRTQEEKDKISFGMMGKKNRLGTRQTIETRIKMSEAKANKTQEQSDNQSAAQRKLDKWPCVLGSRCKCEECNIRRRQYRQNAK